MKKYFALFFLVIASTGFSQKISFSNLDLKGKIELKIIGETDNGFYLHQRNEEVDNKTGYLEVDKQFNAKDLSKMKDGLNLWRSEVFSELIYNGKLAFLTQTRKDKIYTLSLMHPFIEGNSFDISTNKKGFDNVFNTSASERYYITQGRLCNFNSVEPKCERYLITKRSYKTENEETGQFVIDGKYNFLGKDIKPFLPSASDGFKFNSTYFPYDDFVVCRTDYYKKNGKTLKTSINFYNFITKTNNLVSIPEISGHYYFTANYFRDNSNIELIGLYNDNGDKAKTVNAIGVYKYIISHESEKVITENIIPLTQSGLSAFESVKNDKGLKQDFTKILKMDDGSYILFGESHMQGVNMAHEEKDFEVEERIEKYFNIFAFGFDKDGNFRWVHKIDRKENISGAFTAFLGPLRVGYGSFTFLKQQNTIHVFYNDDDKVVDYTINTSGEGKKSFVAFDEKDKVVIFPKDSYVLKGNSILFPCLKNGKSEIVRLDY